MSGPEPGPSPEWTDEAVRARVAEFEQWFAHTDLGGGIIARSTAWPDAPLDSRHMGLGKFEFIVRRNLPDLQGRRVLELGCNNGLISIAMARLGAREVVGVDSSAHWPRVIEQAEFVKSVLEWRCQTRYNVRYVEADLREVAGLDLGRFDAVIALNCLYYLEPDEIAALTRHLAGIAPLFLVQCNTRDQRHLGERPTPRFMARMLAENGFPQVRVDHPWDHPRRGIIPRRYHRPVVVGQR